MNATDSPSSGTSGSGVGRWIALAVLAAAVFVYVMMVTAPNQQGAAPKVRGSATRFPTCSCNRSPARREAVATHDLEGHVTLLNFWGTWCPPCVAEFPHLSELAEKFAANPKFRFYPVSCGGGGSDAVLNELRSETEAFLRTHQSELATYADQDGTTPAGADVRSGAGTICVPHHAGHRSRGRHSRRVGGIQSQRHRSTCERWSSDCCARPGSRHGICSRPEVGSRVRASAGYSRDISV